MWESIHMEDFCRCVRFKAINVQTLWHEYNRWLKPIPHYDYFYNNIPASLLKPYHFDPALSDGNIEQVYGKLRPRAVHHTSVMAPTFKIGVLGAGGGELYGQLHRESERISYFGQFFEQGQCHRMVASWVWVVVIHDIARFNATSRMLTVGHCFAGISQSWLISTSQVCEYVRERASKRVWLFMSLWGDLTVNLNIHIDTHICVYNSSNINTVSKRFCSTGLHSVG